VREMGVLEMTDVLLALPGSAEVALGQKWRKACFLGATTGLPAFHRYLHGCVLAPGPPEGRRRSARTCRPTVVCRQTCEIQVIHGPVRSLSQGLMAFREGGVAAVPAVLCGSWGAVPGKMRCHSLGTRFLPRGDAVSFKAPSPSGF